MTLGERIKKVRRKKDLTQYEFGKRIGIKANSVSLIESGNRNASEQVIISVCREFNVSEKWLRAGEGGMEVKRSRDEELASFVNDLLAGESTDFRRRLVTALSRLNEDQWVWLESVAKTLMEEDAVPTDPPAVQTIAPPPSTRTDEEIDQEVERYRQQLLLEKKMDLQASSAKESGVG